MHRTEELKSGLNRHLVGNFLFIFTYPDGASYGKYIDTYRTNSAWQEFMKKYSNPPIDEMVSDTERIHML
jgi:hypothetical protein